MALIFASAIDLKDGKNLIQRFSAYFHNPTLVFHHFYRNFVATLALFLFLAFYTFWISVSYGSNSYASLPVNSGGGKPATVNVIFSSSDTLEQSGLTPLTDSQSNLVCVLVPLKAGYLVFDPSSQLTILVSNENIVGMIDTTIDNDCLPQSFTPNSTANPTPTATATP